jgi:hypothetical protein
MGFGVVGMLRLRLRLSVLLGFEVLGSGIWGFEILGFGILGFGIWDLIYLSGLLIIHLFLIVFCAVESGCRVCLSCLLVDEVGWDITL